MLNRGARLFRKALNFQRRPRADHALNVAEIIVGCVTDQKPKYLDQAFRLLLSWRSFAGKYAQSRFVICVAGGVPAGYSNSLAPWKPELIGVDPGNDTHPASNKLLFLSLPILQSYKRVILLDCDTVVLREPDALMGPAPLLAKIADIASFPDPAFQQVFAKLGAEKPAADQFCTVSGEASIPYFNSGVLSFSPEAMAKLVPAWIALNRSLMHKPDWLGSHFKYLDQASLAAAVAMTQTQFSLLPQALNYPGHFTDPVVRNLLGIRPIILHYHDRVTNSGLLADSPYPLVQREIRRLNAVLEEAWRLRYASQTKKLGERYAC